ncbi:MAG: 30S ribosome-binding factor RbfA [Trueperella sp.]|uniref:30S ribosome-binding factor RbfA n=1 Tax=Trueperella sp. TaxID=2699835 RepID=UPI0025E12749|nr:30S ribosome-binding factor RbfA [Trueperella sp.]MCI7306267.1 30S ribosome-binding factor RbfA [Trueperella sp.]MDY5402967.1 30S ribosome-binding factor RbfA [Trueperella sp.]
MANTRVDRVADQIHQIVARLIDTKLKDPRLGMVTVTDVRVTGDLQHASVFYTVMGSEEERRQSARALESAKGMIRSAVGKQLGLRLTPTIEFILDSLPETSRTMEDLLAAARKRDEEIRKRAEGAVPVGGENPYRSAAEAEQAAADESDGRSAEAAGAEGE